VQTGGAPLARACQGWESPGRKQRWQLNTEIATRKKITQRV